jgi:hypothetical protein
VETYWAVFAPLKSDYRPVSIFVTQLENSQDHLKIIRTKGKRTTFKIRGNNDILGCFGREMLATTTVGAGFGPQSPRDIGATSGDNQRSSEASPASAMMNLCNIHFHEKAEHKGGEFTTFAGKGDGHGFRNDPTVIMEWALMPDGVAREDVYATLETDAGVQQALKKMDTIKSGLQIWESGRQPVRLLNAGEVAMSSIWAEAV